jgi:class 3 adenylate cyclase
MNGPKLYLLKSLRVLAEALEIAAIVGIVVAAVPRLIRLFFPNSPIGIIAPVQRSFDRAAAPLAELLRRAPHEYAGRDLTPYFIAVLLALLAWGLRTASRRLQVEILTLKELETVSIAAEAAAKAGVPAKLAAIAAGAATDRESVLEVYAQAKRILDGQKKDVTFLAVDVVNSSGMKQGEDPALAERDFRHYRKFVEGCIAKHGALKSAWTPDGVMICFASLEDAVLSGQDLIRGLEKFNREVKSLKSDFAVRCGLNSGTVLFDEKVRMEEMSDGTIDLAGHMQKYADPGTIYASRSVVEGRGEALGFRPNGKTVDGCAIYAWPAA